MRARPVRLRYTFAGQLLLKRNMTETPLLTVQATRDAATNVPSTQALPVLSVKRKADRIKMASLVAELAVRYGCQVTRSEGGTYPGQRCIELYLRAPGGLCVRVALNGDSALGDDHVLSWHMASDSEARLCPARFGGNVNPHHQRKATYIGSGFCHTLKMLERGLALAQDGGAYAAPADLN